MELFIESEEFDLGIMEFEHMTESSFSVFSLDYDDAIIRTDPGFFIESSLENLKKSISNAIDKLVKMIKDFCHKVLLKMQIRSEQINLNKKLEEMKTLMAKKRSIAVNRRVDIFDINKYKKFYSEFINRYTDELIKGMDKDFSSIEAYESWRAKMLDNLSDFNFKLTDEEQWKMSIAINSAVDLTEAQIKNREKNIMMIEKEGSKSLKLLESKYKKIEVENSFIKVNGKNEFKRAIFDRKHNFFMFICSKIAQTLKTLITILTKHTFLCVTALIVVLIAM